MARMRFHHYAWGLLAYNLAVVLGGAFVRASISGDGCGAHWPTCQGRLIPEATRAATLIEFGHRLSTGVLLPLVLLLVVWAFRAYPKGHRVRGGAMWVLALTLVEALIGAGLVLFRLVAHDQSVYRAVAMPAHLIATFTLLMALTLTAWWAAGGRPLQLRGQGGMPWALGLGLGMTLLLGVSGAITALGDTLLLSGSIGREHFLYGLRIYHPLIALSAGLFVLLAAALAMHLRPAPDVQRYARTALLLFMVQMGAGAMNLALLAPIWMQLLHLLLADLFWIFLVLTSAAALAEGVPQVELSRLGAGEAAAPPAGAAARASWKDYVALTKPRIISLLLFTTLTAMAIAAGDTGARPGLWLYLAVALGLSFAAGAANAINMVLEQDLDVRMGRTARRPTVTRRIPARAALQFALALMLLSFLLLWSAANLLSAMLAMAGLAFYVIVYTLLLKRRTWYNIVIGGAAGSFPPLVGWAAVTGDLNAMAWCLFAVIFLWTPVHFWALALLIKEDYARAGVPMLPVVRGERATATQIAVYALLTVAITAVPLLLRAADGRAAVGWLYIAAALVLDGVLLVQSVQLHRRPDTLRARALFKFSMLYLALLFLAMAVDRGHWM